MVKLIVNLVDESIIEAHTSVIFDWEGFEDETEEDILNYAREHGTPVL